MICRSGLTFFGLTPNYRLAVFSQIHEIVYYGNGGYTWETVYSMPLWLRKFTYNKILEIHQSKKNNDEDDVVKKSLAALKAGGNTTTNQTPSYITKASKK